MTVQISEYTNVMKRAQDLECNAPTGLALLPRNFATAESKDDVHESSVPEIRMLWRQAGVPETKIEREGDRFSYAQDKSFEWIGPTLFVSASLLSQDPYVVSIALNVISNYLTDFFKGVPNRNKVAKVGVVVQKSEEEYKRYCYEGHIDGLHELKDIIRETRDHG